jgi:uncharacterized membrane protein
MAFLFMMAAASLIVFGILRVLGAPADWRTTLRVGMGLAFTFTGFDHFISLHSRYLPMIPPYLSGWGTELVLLSGALEIAGAVGLLMPRAAWGRLGLPNLRPFAGLGLAMLLSVMVVANAHVAQMGANVEGLAFGANYAAFRPFVQPFILLWALLASEAVFPPDRPADG